jgi:hypothetical protein
MLMFYFIVEEPPSRTALFCCVLQDRFKWYGKLRQRAGEKPGNHSVHSCGCGDIGAWNESSRGCQPRRVRSLLSFFSSPLFLILIN